MKPQGKPPRFGTLAHEATEWLRAHRDEELTHADMQAKFGRRLMQADAMRLRTACELRLLSRRREYYDRGAPWVYAAGPKR